MGELVTIELPNEVAHQVKVLAMHTNQDIRDMLMEWINRAVAEPSIDSLPDDQVIALSEIQMDEGQQAELSELLARNREGMLSDTERSHLDRLMQVYRHGLVRKAQALKVAVERGLRPPLN